MATRIAPASVHKLTMANQFKLAAEDKAAGQTRLDRLEARILKLEQELFYLKKSLGA